ncbi:MAG: hypothetical protein C5B51_00695 [Terriglobia bacterium]|nr:MAG: hypothetical protein C5B51_00695 [Terriglobia bacterium]
MRFLAALLISPLFALTGDELPRAFFDHPAVRQGQFVLWHDPGAVETLDFRYGIGGPEMAPKEPFTFIEEDSSGSTPKVRIRDANERQWVIKFGAEGKPDTFCSRLAWGLGYYAEPAYFVADGVIAGVHGLGRAAQNIDRNGRFRDGRFQLRSKDPRFLRWVDWAWDDNPFTGTPELNGLKILMMLVSNWDNKDSRDADTRGTNTAIYQHGGQYFYFIDDWGGAMGNWGKFFTRSKWNDKNFYEQSPRFVRLAENGLEWGYSGQHTKLLTRDIRFSDIAWLMQYLGRVTDPQLRAGLLASGASEEETRYYVEGLRQRIGQLQKIVSDR